MADTEFGEIVREALAGESARKAALRCGVSNTQITNMASGVLPRRETLLRFADGLQLTGDVRARLFTTAGYLDSTPAPEPVTA